MKKLVFIALALAAAPVLAQQKNADALPEGLYLGIAGGYSQNNLYKSPAATYTTFEEDKAAYKVSFGYQYNQNIASEVSYANFGKLKQVSNAPNDAENKVSAYSIGLKVYPTTYSAFKPYGRIGAAYLMNKQSGRTAASVYSFPESKWNASYGVGLDYLVTPGFRIGIEYEAYGKTGTTDVTENKPAQVKPQAAFITLTSSF